MEPPALTFSTGPGELAQGARAALQRPLVHHTDPWFRRFYRDLSLELQRALAVAEPPIIVQGEAVVALEAAAASLAAPDVPVLNLASGFYGRWFGDLLRRHGARVVEVTAPLDAVPTPDQVAQALGRHPEVRLVSLVHVETPSGTALPVQEIAAVIRARSEAVILVDAVASFGGMPFDAAGWGIDMAVLGAQKCLGAAPGVTPVHVGPRAWAMMAANPGAPRGSALSLLDWQGTHDPARAFPFTPSILDLYALDGALDDLLAEGVAAAVARHGEVAAAVRAGVRAQGLGFWPRREALMADTVTAVRMPEGVDEREVRRAARARFGVQLAGGDGELAGRVLRIGHMGPAATRANAARALAALAGALTE